MSLRLSVAILSLVVVYGLSIMFAPSTMAAKCDANACISACQKNHPQGGAGQACTSWCLQTMEDRKKKGQCK